MMVPAEQHPFYVNLPRRTLLMAHRGGGGLWPQNTLYAFEQAVSLGADILETDIHLSKDGVLIVMHDDVLDVLTDGRGYIHDLTLDEIKELDAGYRWTNDGGKSFPYRLKGIEIPTLEELFQQFPQMHFNIDMKEVQPGLVESFSAMISKYHMEEKVLAASFQHENITAFRQRCPQIATAASQKETLDFFLLQSTGLARLFRSPGLVFQVPEMNGALRVTTPRFIQAAHALGKRVDIWTVDSEADMRRLMEWGADGLFTDRPDIMKPLVAG